MGLEVQHFSFEKKDKKILNDVSLQVPFGKIIAFLGPNGAGKTTLLRFLIGMNRLDSKHDHSSCCILFKDICWTNTLMHERISAGLVYLPQHCTLFFELTAQENLEVIFHYHDFWQSKKKEVFQEQLEVWAKQLGVLEVLHKKASFLSGGQKRKVEIIRALLMQPFLLLLDEPFAGVDPKSIEELQELFQMLALQNMGILISDHHVFQLLSFADYSYVLFQGMIVASGLSEEIVHNNRIQEIYLGKKFVYLQ